MTYEKSVKDNTISNNIIQVEIIDNVKHKVVEPKDRFNIIYVLFFLYGIVGVLPMTFFTTATQYWLYKFRNTSVEIYNADDRTPMQAQFSSVMSTSTQVANVVFLFIGTFFGHKFKLYTKLNGCLAIILALFITSALFIKINTDTWQNEFFIMSMCIIALASGFNSMLGISLLSMITYFPHHFLKPFVIGQGISSLCTSAMQIVSLAIGMSVETSAIIYFGLGITTIVMLLVLSITTKNNPFARHYLRSYHEGDKEELISLSEFVTIYKKLWSITLATIFGLLSITPVHTSVTALVVSEGEGNGDWNDIYFSPVITFFLYYTADIVGRYVSVKLKKNLEGISFVLVNVARMIVFVPVIMLCNAKPRSHLPVVFPHDYQYMLIMIAYGSTAGYMMSVTFLNIPKLVCEQELKHAFPTFLLSNCILTAGFSFLGVLAVDLL